MKNLVVVIFFILVGCYTYQKHYRFNMEDWYFINKEGDCIAIKDAPFTNPDNIADAPVFRCTMNIHDNGNLRELKCLDTAYAKYIYYYYAKDYQKCIEYGNRRKQYK